MAEIGIDLGLRELRRANLERQAEWCPDQAPDLSFRGNELAGETGEACNVIKKLERERHGWCGSRDTIEHLGDELADVVICADLVAIAGGIDLAEHVVAKFNAASDANGLATRIAASSQGAKAPSPIRGEAINTERVRKAMEDGKGFWLSCSGCHELNEGHPTGRYSAALRCHLGLGCTECGGIGAVWDTTNYEDMAAAMAAAPDPTGIDAVQVVREHFAKTQEAMGFHESARTLRAGSNSPIEQGIGFGRVLVGVRAVLDHLSIPDLSEKGEG